MKSTELVNHSSFQLIVPDLRGHGRSSILSKPFRHREAAADILVLLDHLKAGATMQPGRIQSMVLVSATPYFPAQARPIMRHYPDSLPEQQWEILRRSHPGGDAQIRAILASAAAFADSYDDMNRAIPQSSLWIVPNSGHGPVIGERWPEFLKTAVAFLRG